MLAYVIVGAVLAGLPDPARAADAEIEWRATHLLGVSRATGEGIAGPDQLSFNQLQIFVSAGEVPARVAARLGHRGNPDVLADEIVVAGNQNSGAFRISSTNVDAERAVTVADLFAEELTTYLDERELARQEDRIVAGLARLERLETELRDAEERAQLEPDDPIALTALQSLRSQYSVVFEQVALRDSGRSGLVLTTLEAARPVPVDRGLSAPRSRIGRAFAGAAAGLAIGIGISVLLARAERRIRSVAEVEALTREPVPVVVPDRHRSEMNELIVTPDRHDFAAESYRTLTRVALLAHRARHDDASTPVIVVTSPDRADGRTGTAAEIAVSLAEIHAGSLAVNADFRRPQLAQRLSRHTASASGLLDADSLEHAPPELLIHPTDRPGLSIVDLTGTPGLDPGDLTRATVRLVDELRRSASAVVVDTAAVTTAAESLETVAHADVVVLVVRLDHTLKASVVRTVELIRSVSDATVIPVVTGGRDSSASLGSYTSVVGSGIDAADRRS